MSKLKLIFLAVPLMVALFAYAAEPTSAPQETSPAAPAKKVLAKKHSSEILSCHGKALVQKDCLLQVGKEKLQVWHDKVIYTDPLTSVTEAIPGQNGDADHPVEWQSLGLQHVSSRWFLILTYWTAPDKNTGIETLFWVVFEIAGGHVPVKLQKAIQKRVKNNRGKWRNDSVIAHQLIFKGGEIYALFGRDKILLN